MGNFWKTLDTVGTVLNDIDDTNKTVQHGYEQTRRTAENADRTVKCILSGEYSEADKKIMEYERKTGKCYIRTVVFCVFMIAVTVLVCIFL